MRRRETLATAGAIGTGSIAGCLGSLLGENAASCGHETLSGRSQWRYDACNSGHAVGISGPTEEPDLQRIYRGPGAPPLTENGALFTETWSAEIGGEPRWQIDESRTADRRAALYEDNVLGLGDPFDGFWAAFAADGSEHWRTELSQGISSPLTIQADQAYFATTTGVGCVDLVAQEEAWVADLDAETPYLLHSTQWELPAATPEHVFVLTSFLGGERDWETHPRQFYALDPETGEPAWTVELEPGERAVEGGPIVADGLVFVLVTVEPHAEEATDLRLRIIAVDPSAREVAWRKTLAGRIGFAIPAAANGRFYITHGNRPEVPVQLVALDTDDGSVVWRTEHHSQAMTPTIAEEAIVVCEGNRLWAFDPETGDAHWDVNLWDRATAQTDEFRAASRFVPVVHDGRVFVYLGEDLIAEFA